MQPLNSDRDDLFKRAAEGYPLNTSGADWNAVLQKMNTAGEVKEKESDNRKFLWLLLLLPLGFLCNRDWIGENHEQFSEAKGGNTVQKQEQHLTVSPLQQTTLQGHQLAPASSPGVTSGTVSSTSAYHSQRENFSPYPETVASGGIVKREKDRVAKTGKLKTEKGTSSKNAPDYTWAQDQARNSPASGKQATGDAATNTEKKRPPLWIEEGHAIVSEMGWPSGKEKYVVPDGSISNKKEVTRKKKIYAGIVGGIDFTTIRLQRFDEPGFDAGILLGYQLSSRISVESGVIYNKKFYYTNGDKIDASKFYLNPGTKLAWVDGACAMWEIPFTVRYSFPSERKKTWFIGAGVSNYLMKREGYDYEYTYAAGGAAHRKYYAHSVTKMEWLSALQISGGYQRNVGKTGILRIEPYIKLPLQNIGSVDLPMQSSGLRVAFTKGVF